jgi:hypothetical protein
MYRDGNFAVVDGGYFCTCEYAGNNFLDTMCYNANIFYPFLISYLFNLSQYLRKIKLFGYRVFLIYAVRFSLMMLIECVDLCCMLFGMRG